MRDPVLYGYSKYVAQHDSDPELESKICSGCNGKDTETIQEPVHVNSDLEASDPHANSMKNTDLIWSSNIRIDDDSIYFEIENVPIKKADFPDKLEDEIVEKATSKIESSSSSVSVDKVNDWEIPDRPEIRNPLIDTELFKDIILRIGFSTDDNMYYESDQIGGMTVQESGEVVIGSEFDAKTFNDKFKQELRSRASKWYETLKNPYSSLFKIESMSPFFIKHGDIAVDVWSNFKDELFTHNPLESNYVCFEHLIEDNMDRFDYLSAWSDLIELIKFELVDLSVRETKKEFLEIVTENLDIDSSEEAEIPWFSRTYNDVRTNVVEEYETEDFNYNKEDLQSGLDICVNVDDKFDIIYESSCFRRYGGLNGSIVPKGWIVEPKAITPADSNSGVTRCDMYERLLKEKNYRYIRSEEISDYRMCTESELKPVVQKDGSYDNVKEKLRKYTNYKDRIKQAVNEGYRIETVNLSEFFDIMEWSGGYMGWHTGTVCSEFPFEASVDGEKDFNSYEKFEESGSISYKTSTKIVIKPDWNTMLGDDVSINSMTDSEIVEALDKNGYSVNDKIVITLHNLP